MRRHLAIAGVLLVILIAGCGTMVEGLSQGTTEYDFRESRWGDHINKVKFSESGRTIMKQTDRLLVYREKIGDANVKLVYTFDAKQRLRAAGYLTDQPISNARPIMERALALHGEPTGGGAVVGDGMEWRTGRSLIYADMHARVKLMSEFKVGGGPLSYLLSRSKEKTVAYWDGVWGYMDLKFIDELALETYPIYSLTHYEQRLMGVLQARAVSYYKGQAYPEDDRR